MKRGTYHCLQRNPYIADAIGELRVDRYRVLAIAEGFYKYYMTEIRTCMSFWPLAALQGWPLGGVALYTVIDTTHNI